MLDSFWNMKPILWAQFSAVLAGAITMSWNFLGYKFIVFKVKAAPTPSPDRNGGEGRVPTKASGKNLFYRRRLTSNSLGASLSISKFKLRVCPFTILN